MNAMRREYYRLSMGEFLRIEFPTFFFVLFFWLFIGWRSFDLKREKEGERGRGRGRGLGKHTQN